MAPKLTFLTFLLIFCHQSGLAQVLLCDFNNGQQHSRTLSCLCDGAACALEQEMGVGGNIDWQINMGATPSSDTGPSDDHTWSNSSGKYIFIEASDYQPNDYAKMSTPLLDLTNSPASCLVFWYHMYGQHTGDLEVSLRYNNGSDNILSWARTGNQGDQWLQGLVGLTPDVIQAHFTAVRGGEAIGMPFGDTALDDIMIETSMCPGFTLSPTRTTAPTAPPSTSTGIGTTRTPTTTSQGPIQTSHIGNTYSVTDDTTGRTTTTPVRSSGAPSGTPPASSSSTISSRPPLSSTSPAQNTHSYDNTSVTSVTSISPSDSDYTVTGPSGSSGTGSQTELWGMDETFWIIIFVVIGVVVLLLLIIVCVQACAMRRMRSARFVQKSDDYSNIEAFSRGDGRNIFSDKDYINAYDNKGVEPDDTAMYMQHTNGTH